jgi:hypothetical protein
MSTWTSTDPARQKAVAVRLAEWDLLLGEVGDPLDHPTLA